jgi:acyl-CoA reductase-like NAD-dependent aldehyde dehydrogenase
VTPFIIAFHNALSPIMAGLFAGNAVVIKCSEQVLWSCMLNLASWTMLILAYSHMVHRCCSRMSACMRPTRGPCAIGLLLPFRSQCVDHVPSYQVCISLASVSQGLTPRRHITFIGSEPVGRKVLQAATINLTPVTLELGGKDPCVILPETNLKKWSDIWLRGAFQNAGQNCIGIERFIVHSSQHRELVDIFAEKTKKLRFGPALAEDSSTVAAVDCGAMISRNRSVNFYHVSRTFFKDDPTLSTC